jgi:hypothetical protein
MNALIKNKNEYERRARYLTDLYRKNINPPSTIKYPHLDHIVSIDFGWEHDIPVEVITLPENLTWKEKKENLSKGSSLTEEGISLLSCWRKNNLISTSVGSILPDENLTFSLKEMFEEVKLTGISVVKNLPSSIAYNFNAVWCQRLEELRWEKTKRALGKIPLPTHRMMMCAVYPDNRIERLDGNTRTFIFKNNLQHEGYEPPKDWCVVFFAVKDEKEAERLYHSIDSSDTAETFNEKLGGYLRARGYHSRLPNTFAKGDRVYDIAVVVLDKYIAKNEKEELTLPRSVDAAGKAAITAERLDYFIEEFVLLGQMIGKENVPFGLTAPLMGMMIRYLMRDKSDKTTYPIKVLIDYLKESKYTPFSRPVFTVRKAEKNLFIMMDELQTSESINNAVNYNVKGVDVTTRRIIPNQSTKTTTNEMDRKLYCGWIAYCFNKYFRGEIMDEDIIFDVTGKRITNKTTWQEACNITSSAQSIIISEYDNFWKKNVS